MSAEKGGGRMIRRKSCSSKGSIDSRRAGADTHTFKSYHNGAISQPVGGGF